MTSGKLLLPKGLPVERVVARIGLISDTHMPQRCAAFPAAVFDALAGFVPDVDWGAEFDVAMGQFQTPIVEEGLREDINELMQPDVQ
jgi:hypothetical protein